MADLKKKNWSSKKKLLVFLPVFIILLFVGWFISAIYFDEPPQFFPLNDPQGKYTILKSPIGNSSCKDKEQDIKRYGDYYKNSRLHYVVRYEGKHAFEGIGKTDCLDMYVGKSKENLEEFVGKQVKIEGKWVSSSKQCIDTKCEDIWGPYVVLNIDSIKPFSSK